MELVGEKEEVKNEGWRGGRVKGEQGEGGGRRRKSKIQKNDDRKDRKRER